MRAKGWSAGKGVEAAGSVHDPQRAAHCAVTCSDSLTDGGSVVPCY